MSYLNIKFNFDHPVLDVVGTDVGLRQVFDLALEHYPNCYIEDSLDINIGEVTDDALAVMCLTEEDEEGKVLNTAAKERQAATTAALDDVKDLMMTMNNDPDYEPSLSERQQIVQFYLEIRSNSIHTEIV